VEGVKEEGEGEEEGGRLCVCVCVCVSVWRRGRDGYTHTHTHTHTPLCLSPLMLVSPTWTQLVLGSGCLYVKQCGGLAASESGFSNCVCVCVCVCVSG
jgi:hypothetical protein